MKKLNKILMVGVLLSFSSCAYISKPWEAYKAMPDDNPIEEGVEWAIETGAELLGEDIHLDLSGDSPEDRSGKK